MAAAHSHGNFEHPHTSTPRSHPATLRISVRDIPWLAGYRVLRGIRVSFLPFARSVPSAEVREKRTRGVKNRAVSARHLDVRANRRRPSLPLGCTGGVRCIMKGHTSGTKSSARLLTNDSFAVGPRGGAKSIVESRREPRVTFAAGATSPPQRQSRPDGRDDDVIIARGRKRRESELNVYRRERERERALHFQDYSSGNQSCINTRGLT